MSARVKSGLSTEMKRYVHAITGKSVKEISALTPNEEAELASSINGTPVSWPNEYMGSFRGRRNINITHRRFKTLNTVDTYLNELVNNGARQY